MWRFSRIVPVLVLGVTVWVLIPSVASAQGGCYYYFGFAGGTVQCNQSGCSGGGTYATNAYFYTGSADISQTAPGIVSVIFVVPFGVSPPDCTRTPVVTGMTDWLHNVQLAPFPCCIPSWALSYSIDFNPYSGSRTTTLTIGNAQVVVIQEACPGTSVAGCTGTPPPPPAGQIRITNVPPLPAGMVGTSYSQALTATGGTPPYTWSATGLPTGLAVDPKTGVISGTPTAGGDLTVNVQVTDSVGATASKAFALSISSNTIALMIDPPIVAPSKSESTYKGRQSVPYYVTVTATVTDASQKTVGNYVVDFDVEPQDVLVSGHNHNNTDALAPIINASGSFIDPTTRTPLGIFPSCNTDPKSGSCSLIYKVPEVSGVYQVLAASNQDRSTKASQALPVQLLGPLGTLTESPTQFFFLTGGPGRQQIPSDHFDNHFASPFVQRAAAKVAAAYSQTFTKIGLNGRKLGINDMSLAHGGLFDICNDWTPAPVAGCKGGHNLHRNGRSVDIDSSVTIGDVYGGPTVPVDLGLLIKLFESWGMLQVPEGTIHFESSQ